MPGPDGAAPWSVRDDGLWIAVRVTPKARRAGVTGVAADADGRWVLKLSVTAPPEDGKANAAVEVLLAKTWGVARRDVDVIQGHTDRRKVVRLAGDATTLAETLRPWLDALPWS